MTEIIFGAAAGVVLVLTGLFVWWINQPLDIPRSYDPKRKAFMDELHEKLREQDRKDKGP